MASVDSFKQEQRGVALAMVCAFVVTVMVLGMVLVTDRSVALSFGLRLQSTIRVELLVVAWLAAAIANVARLRFFSRTDIAGSGFGPATAEVEHARAILQNTLEQVGLATGTHLIVAATFSRSVAIVIALACLFAIGRLLFWLGYKRGAKHRAFGFGLTFYPSVLALLAAAGAMVSDWAF